MNYQTLLESIQNPKLEQTWKETLTYWDDSEINDREDLLDFIKNKRNQFLEMLNEVGEDGDWESLIAVEYIELKSLWINLNTQIQYQYFTKGKQIGATAYKASVTSMFLEVIEQFIPNATRDKINVFLGETAKLSEERERSESSPVAIVEGLDLQLNDLYGEKESLLTKLGVGQLSEIPDLVESMDLQLREYYDLMKDSILIENGQIEIRSEEPFQILYKKGN